MAIKSNQNFLNFTKLTYSEILTQVNNKLASDPKFTNFRESSIAQIMLEIFAASTDMTNYYVERRAEENYFDTARLKSSVILLAKQLGYVVTRPIPAKSAFSMTINGPLPSGLIADTDKITLLKYGSTYSHQGFNYLSKNTYSYTFTQSDINNGTGNADFVKVIDSAVVDITGITLDEQGNIPTSATSPIELIQGELITKEFLGTAPSAPIGQTFQKYSIGDVKFSNLYGSEDLGFDKVNNAFNLAEDLTQIGIGNNVSAAFQEENLYEIDRRSLLTSQTVLDSTSVSANVPQVVTVKTTMDETIELIFGDGILASKGPVTSLDNMYVKYLSTDGKSANQIGVINEKINPQQAYRTSNSNIDMTSNLDFKFTRNVTAGADLEDIDSIKINAPQLYYSLDRLVTRADYNTYLKSLTSPINVNNSLSWGEQEETNSGLVNNDPNTLAIKKLFNIALYSVAGELYSFPPGGESTVRSLSADTDQAEVYLEGTDVDLFNGQTLFNLYVTGVSADCNNGGNAGVVEEIGKVQALASTHPVQVVNDQLDTKAQITVRHIYVSPIIQQFELIGNIFIQNLSSLSETRTKINNAVYKFLNDKADFNSPIYISNLHQEIEQFPEVINADVKIVALDSPEASITGSIIDEPELADFSTADQLSIKAIFDTELAKFVAGDAADLTNPSTSASNNYDIGEFDKTQLSEATWTKTGGWITDNSGHFRIKDITERRFYFELFRGIYNQLAPINVSTGIGSFRDSNNFKSLMFKYDNALKITIRNGMLDASGNITNYSLKNEISQVNINANFKYRV